MLAPRKVNFEAQKRERENLEFRTFLKCNADDKELDEQFAKLHNELFANYECNRCRNCCKMYHGSIPETDIENDSLYLEMDSMEFVEQLDDLAEVPKCNAVLEADVGILGVSVNDRKYKRPANPATCMIADAASGMMLKCELQEPDEDPIVSLAEELVGFIFQYGAPKEVRISNILVEAGLEQICETCGIKLRRVRKLQAIEEFREGMKRFM